MNMGSTGCQHTCTNLKCLSERTHVGLEVVVGLPIDSILEHELLYYAAYYTLSGIVNDLIHEPQHLQIDNRDHENTGRTASQGGARTL